MPHAEVEKFPENAFIIIQTATFHNSKQKLSELLAEQKQALVAKQPL